MFEMEIKAKSKDKWQVSHQILIQKSKLIRNLKTANQK
jgi:hypothetical protein